MKLEICITAISNINSFLNIISFYFNSLFYLRIRENSEKEPACVFQTYNYCEKYRYLQLYLNMTLQETEFVKTFLILITYGLILILRL